MDDPVVKDFIPHQATIDLTLETTTGLNGGAAAEEDTWTTDGSGKDGENFQEQRQQRWQEEEEEEEAQEDGRPVRILQRPSQQHVNSKQNRSRANLVVQQAPSPTTAAAGRTPTLKAQNKGKGKAKPSGLSEGNGGKTDKMQAL
ncbi:hypothetical protein BG006_004887, partial [Podila minutissima]